jgi:hypothetical protein
MRPRKMDSRAAASAQVAIRSGIGPEASHMMSTSCTVIPLTTICMVIVPASPAWRPPEASRTTASRLVVCTVASTRCYTTLHTTTDLQDCSSSAIADAIIAQVLMNGCCSCRARVQCMLRCRPFQMRDEGSQGNYMQFQAGNNMAL